jgi:transposase
MPNQLKVDLQEAIKHLLKTGRSQRWIARELCVHRLTVKRYCDELLDSKCTIPLTGSKCTIVPTGKLGRISQCEAHRERIESKVRVGLTAQRIYQDLQSEVNFAGGYDSVRRFVKKLKATEPSVVWRLECEPGEEVQIDYGEMYLLEGETGRLRKAYFLRVILSCSRKGYTEASLRPNTESFIRCLENAFRHFGGVARRACIDNLKAVVQKADWYEPRLRPKLLSFARHYGFTFMPARPYTPTDKGKVENAIKYVKNNALKGRRFKSLAELNTFLQHWESSVADRRIHGTTRKQVQQHFSEVERPRLLPLPASLFECFEEGQRKVHRDGYVEVKRAYYHVPREYVRGKVWVRWDSRQVRIFNHRMEQIAIHTRLEPGQFSQILGVAGVRHSVTESLRYHRNRIETLGHHCLAWADVLIGRNPDQALRQIQGLLALSKRSSHHQLDQACRHACENAQYSLRQLKAQLARPSQQEIMPLLEEHPLIRSPSSYETLLPTKHLFKQPL